MSSSRLRGRLARDDFEESQAAKATENFVLVGTPLPSLAKRDPNEGKPEWEQEVRDEQGRRRFHGAFTGGWSAGYFNTVGSKEGWTPSTFTSSRNSRGKETQQRPAQRPEDFMDEEDLAELDSTRNLSQQAGYTASTPRTAPAHDDEVLGDLLGLGRATEHLEQASSTSELIAPKTSLGHKILVKMGWRPGSGTGPRVTAARRALLESLYSLKPSIAAPKVQGDQTALVFPPDTPMPALADGMTGKKDTHGLGWEDQGQQQPPPQARTVDPMQQNQPSSRGFDISVLEEADADDVNDIFGSSETIQDAIQRRRAHQTTAQQSSRLSETPARKGGSREDDRTRTWHDGKPLPPGFSVEVSQTIDDRRQQGQSDWHAPPAVPPGWKPDPIRVWSQAKSSMPPPATLSASSTHNNSQIQASQRADMLGEARMPGPPPNLQSYLPQQAASKREGEAEQMIQVPRLDAVTARAGLNGFIPFGNDAQKQQRYVAYLESQVDQSSESAKTIRPIPGKTVQQTRVELEEFARSASIFKPMSSAMANRFASAMTKEGAGDVHAPTPGLYQPEVKSRQTIEEETKRREREEEDRAKREKEEAMSDAQRAARAGMFGHLTRSVKDWYPPRLLCKRFGVPDPHPNRSGSVAEDGDGDEPTRTSNRLDDAFSTSKNDSFERSDARREIKKGEARWEKSKRELMQLAGQRNWEDKGGQPLEGSEVDGSLPLNGSDPIRASQGIGQDLENVGLGEDEEQLKAIETFAKPSRDIFKSVFASDEEDDDEPGEAVSQAKPSKASSRVVPLSGAVASSITTSTQPSTPTFVPRHKRLSDEKAAVPSPQSRDLSREKKKKKARKSAPGTLTFSVDDDGSEEMVTPTVKRQKREAIDGQKVVEGSQQDKGDRTSQKTRMRASDLF